MSDGQDWGWTVAPATRCPGCDSLTEPGSTFCGRCGHRLRESDPYTADALSVLDVTVGPLTPEEPPTAPWYQPADTGRERSAPSAVNVVLAAGWAVGGVMLFVAPFLALFTVRIDVFRARVDYEVSGWGQVRGLRGTDAIHGHEPRYGVLLVATAVLVLCAAAGLVLRPHSRRPLVLGVTGSAVSVLVLVLLALAAESNASYSDLMQTHSAGSGLWLALTGSLAVLFTGAAGVAALRAARRSGF